MAVGCVDKVVCCTSSYAVGQVDNEITEEECAVRNEAYWRTVEEALSAKDSEDDDDNEPQKSDHVNVNRISVDAFMPSIEESPSPSVISSPRSKVIDPLVLAPPSESPLRSTHANGMQYERSSTAKFVMDMPNELKGRGGSRTSRVRSLMPTRKWNFRHSSRALDYHSLGSASSYQRRCKLLADTDETSLTSLSTAMSTEAETSLNNSQRSISSGDRLSPVRSTEIKRSESRLEAKLRSGSHRAHRPSLREIMDESVHSLPYLTMSQGYEV